MNRNKIATTQVVIPAKAGIQVSNNSFKRKFTSWIPAFAGMTRYLILAVLFGGIVSVLLSAEKAAPEIETPAASAPKIKKHKAGHKKRVLKATEAPKSVAKIKTDQTQKSSRSESFQMWLREVKKRIARAQTRNNQVVAVAAVRGSETPDSPPLYWKGKNASGPVEASELKQFDEAIDTALTSDPGSAKEKLQAFLSAHPQSPLAGEARETLNQLEKPAN